ncbi:DUF4097 domain-containing protein [Streptomyces sp. NPDC056524]|uniref:DUF4097 family beta strand repeat-containing protein n=1 Tax=Streptomyces sp. NPDC056524 TaxID=3345851 RepID=UPI0036798804
MPSYDTPQPITASLQFEVGDVRIAASKRASTVVEVRPSNASEEADIRAAQQTDVTYADGVLTVKGPKNRSLFGRHGSIDVTVELPAGSHLRSTSPMGNHTCEGPLGDCRVKTSLGDIRLAEAGDTDLRTGHGSIAVERAVGKADIQGAGRIAIGEIMGPAAVANSNGDTAIGEITGDLTARSSNGGITVGIAHASVEAKAANGSIRVDEVARGVVQLRTSAGNVEIGIHRSTAAWLDVNSRIGTVRNALDAAEGPATTDETVEIHARTGVGDIVVRRA